MIELKKGCNNIVIACDIESSWAKSPIKLMENAKLFIGYLR